jgi:hypothetical protein
MIPALVFDSPPERSFLCNFLIPAFGTGGHLRCACLAVGRSHTCTVGSFMSYDTAFPKSQLFFIQKNQIAKRNLISKKNNNLNP